MTKRSNTIHTERAQRTAVGTTRKKFRVEDFTPLVNFVASALGDSKRAAKALIDARGVFVNGRRCWMAKHQLSLGDTVELILPNDQVSLDAPSESLLSILFEGERALVLDKPPGIECTNGERQLEQILKQRFADARILHRLDRETSGCVLATRSSADWEFFLEQFTSRSIKKIYRALLLGEPPRKRHTVDAPIDGKPARSHFKVLRSANGVSDCEIEIASGRMHQIRKHALTFGAAVLGDRAYEHRKVPERFRSVGRQLLHASHLTFVPAPDAEAMIVESPIPLDMQEWMRRVFGEEYLRNSGDRHQTE